MEKKGVCSKGTVLRHQYCPSFPRPAEIDQANTASGWKLAFIWYQVKNTKWMVIEVQGPAKFAKDPVLIEKKPVVTISFMFCLETELKWSTRKNTWGELTGFSPWIRRIFPLENIQSKRGKFLLFRPYDISKGSGPSASYGYCGSWMCQWPRPTWATHLFSRVATLQPTEVSLSCCVWGKHISSVELRVAFSLWLMQKGKGWGPAHGAPLQFEIVGTWWQNHRWFCLLIQFCCRF